MRKGMVRSRADVVPIAEAGAAQKKISGKWVLAPLLGLAAMVGSPAVWAQCPPNNEVGKQFPGPPERDDLRQTLMTSRGCMETIQPRKLSQRELQDLRRAIREHAASHGRKLPAR